MTFAPGYTLHETPYRHYKAVNPETGKVTWNGAGGKRIYSITDILDGGADALTQWAIANTLIAAERAVVQWLDAAPALATSVLDFAALAELTGLMPDSIRDAKADLGTLAHTYFAARMAGDGPPAETQAVPYGYRCAIDEWIAETRPTPIEGDGGLHVERAVGDFERAVAGTYDAQAWLLTHGNKFIGARHRIDLKTSRSVQPKHFAQVAAYERCGRLCGEVASEYLTVLHIDPLEGAKPYTIAAYGAEYQQALAVFDHYLGIRRGEAGLAKLLKSC